jgi:hypothetical protein
LLLPEAEFFIQPLEALKVEDHMELGMEDKVESHIVLVTFIQTQVVLWEVTTMLLLQPIIFVEVEVEVVQPDTTVPIPVMQDQLESGHMEELVEVEVELMHLMHPTMVTVEVEVEVEVWVDLVEVVQLVQVQVELPDQQVMPEGHLELEEPEHTVLMVVLEVEVEAVS